jgi:hypothetical protein
MPGWRARFLPLNKLEAGVLLLGRSPTKASLPATAMSPNDGSEGGDGVGPYFGTGTEGLPEHSWNPT